MFLIPHAETDYLIEDSVAFALQLQIIPLMIEAYRWNLLSDWLVPTAFSPSLLTDWRPHTVH